MQSIDSSRILVATGGCRHGEGRARALLALEGKIDPASLLEHRGGVGSAIAMYEASTGVLTLGRDPLGIEPLYVSLQPDRVLFATEIGSFAALLGEPAEPEPQAIAMYLDYGFAGGHRTALQRIERVLPGESIRIDGAGRVERFRQPFPAGREDAPISDLRVASEKFDGLFESAVASQVNGQGECSLLLSGGLDSALICSVLSKLSGRPVTTVSVGYSFTRSKDELADAKRIALLFGTRHAELRLDLDALWNHLPYMVSRMDELVDDPAALPTSLIAERLHGAGGVVFTGEGADDVFAGDGRYRRWRVQRILADLAAPGSGGWRTHGIWLTSNTEGVCGQALAKASHCNRSDLIAAWGRTPREWSWLQRAQCVELAELFPNTLALKVARSLGDADASVSMPFLDPAIVRFGLSLGDQLKVRGRVGKYFLREWASHDRLPRDYVMKRKRGFHVPIGALLEGEHLRGLESALMASTLVKQWFRADGIARLFKAQRTDGSCSEVLWRLLHLAMWHTLAVLRPGSLPGPSEDPLAWIQ